MNPAVKALLIFIFGLLTLSFLFAPRPKPVDYTLVNFDTSADSRIYFNNIRSYYYRIDGQSKKPMVIYRLKKRSAALDSSSLQFNIILNPQADQAFAFAKLGANFEQYDSLKVKFIDYQVNSLSNMNSEDHYQLAAKVYSSLLKNQKIHLIHRSDTLKRLYADKVAQLSVETTLEDYFKLVNKNK